MDQAEAVLRAERATTDQFRKVIALLLMVLGHLVGITAANSNNSSIAPSQDPHRPRGKGKNGDDKKGQGKKRAPGGQKGRKKTSLELVDNPDEVHPINIDRSSLPEGNYVKAPNERRQVVELEIKKRVIEYSAEILVDDAGNEFRAPFPEGVSHPAQYGSTVKTHAVYLSQFQLIPYKRLSHYFRDSCDIGLSEGTIFNFNKQAYDKLEEVENRIKAKLGQEPVINADETGVNIMGKLAWLHVASSPKFVVFFAHHRRGGEAMHAMGVLPDYKGVVCHDHWKAYFRFDFEHALCNAHHLRELTAAHERDEHAWPDKMRKLLLAMNEAMKEKGGSLDAETARKWLQKYRKIIADGELECPAPTERLANATRGRIAKSKSRNLLERLRDFENETLRFLTEPLVPFTNNQGENDIRMTKVKENISGGFRTLENAGIFCRVRGYILTCQRLGVSAHNALQDLFKGSIPPQLEEALR